MKCVPFVSPLSVRVSGPSVMLRSMSLYSSSPAPSVAADVPGPLAVAHVAGQRRLVQLEAAAAAAQRRLVIGVAEGDAHEHPLGDLHVAADHDGIGVAAAAAKVAAAIVIAVVVDRVGVELVLPRAARRRRRSCAIQGAKIRLLDLQRRFGEQTDLLRRFDLGQGIVGDDLMARGRRVHAIGEQVGLGRVRRDQRRGRAGDRTGGRARRRR